MKKKISLALITALALSYCQTPPRVVDTQALKGKTAAEREQAYKENAITVGGAFTPYKVGQNPFQAEALSPLFEAPYVEQRTKDMYASGNTWNVVGGIFGAAGGAMVGWNLGTTLAGRQVETGLWIGGGATIVVASFVAIIADGKYAEASNLYNNDLYKALDLQQKISALKPQEQFPHYNVALSHSF